MGLAMNLYVLDYDDKTMPFTHRTNEYWFHQLAPYLSAADYKNDPEEHLKKMQVAFCPLAKRQKDRPDETSFFGTSTKAWRFMGGEGGYGLNLWLLPNNAEYPDIQPENYFKRYSNTRADVPLMGDSVWVGSWPDSVDTMPDDLSGDSGYYPHAAGYFMWRFCIQRHGDGINIAFADSHVAQYRLPELWTLKWHRHFIPTSGIEAP
jgi:prepilin-type processing-associated H-X9-DG protein